MKLFRTLRRNYHLSCLMVSLKGSRSIEQRERIVKHTFDVIGCLSEKEKVVVFGPRFKTACTVLRDYLSKRVVFRNDLQFILNGSSSAGVERGLRFLELYRDYGKQIAGNELDLWYEFYSRLGAVLKHTQRGSR